MASSDLQDLVFQWSGGKMKLPEMRGKIMSLAQHRALMGRPALEVDKLQATSWCDDHHCHEEHERRDGGRDRLHRGVVQEVRGRGVLRQGVSDPQGQR